MWLCSLRYVELTTLIKKLLHVFIPVTSFLISLKISGRNKIFALFSVLYYSTPSVLIIAQASVEASLDQFQFPFGIEISLRWGPNPPGAVRGTLSAEYVYRIARDSVRVRAGRIRDVHDRIRELHCWK